jgi:hypothetical protein
MAKATQFWGRMKGFVTKKPSGHLTPVKRKNMQFSIGIGPQFDYNDGTDMGHCIQIQLPLEKGSEPPLFLRAA